jgi:transcriptional regulator with XRE-family HTH domain
MAEACGVSSSTVSRWETGARVPTPEQAEAYRKFVELNSSTGPVDANVNCRGAGLRPVRRVAEAVQRPWENRVRVYPRGICPLCLARIPLNREGTLTRHLVKITVTERKPTP